MSKMSSINKNNLGSIVKDCLEKMMTTESSIKHIQEYPHCQE